MRVIAEGAGVNRLAFAPGGGLLYAAGDGGRLIALDPAGGAEVRGASLDGTSWFSGLAVSSDGELLATVGRHEGQERQPNDWCVTVWDARSLAVLWQEWFYLTFEVGFLPGTRRAVTAAQARQNNGPAAGSLHLLGGDGIDAYVLYGDSACSLDVSGEGLVATGGHDGSVRIHDLAGQRELFHTGSTSTVRAVRFSPDGNQLVAAGGSRVSAWDWRKRSPVWELEDLIPLPWALVFTPDGQRLLSGDSLGVVHVRDAASGELRAAYDWQRGDVRDLAVSPDGLIAVAACQGGVVVWDAEG